MLDLNDLYYFVQVVDHHGFSAAGRAMNLPKSRLSRRIALLEQTLDARLLSRSSRKMALTDAGRALYQHARAMLVEAEAAEDAVRHRQGEPLGAVRFACSVAMAQFVMADLLPRFMLRYPRVNVLQHASNHYVDPVGEGFDLVLRAHTGPLPDSSLIQRNLATARWCLMAAPSYLAQSGTPQSPAELQGHSALKLGSTTAEGRWQLQSMDSAEKNEATIPFAARFCSDDMTGLKQAAVAGLGIVAMPGYICRPEIEDGRLVQLLPQWCAGQARLSLLMPSRRGQPPSVQALAAFLAAEVPAIVQQ